MLQTIDVKFSKNCKLLEFHFTHYLTTTIYLLPKLLSLCHPFFPGQTNFNLTIFGAVNFCLQYVCFLCILINTRSRVSVIICTLSIKSQAHGITSMYDCGLEKSALFGNYILLMNILQPHTFTCKQSSYRWPSLLSRQRISACQSHAVTPDCSLTQLS